MRLLAAQQAAPVPTPAPPPAPQQMTPEMQQLLDQLKDIHEPAAIGWWPLAPGWWVAAGILLALIFAIAVLLLRVRQQRRKNQYRTEGVRLLKAVNIRAPRAVEEINILLKRVAVVTFGRKRCAALTGNNWIQFLQQTAQPSMPESAQRALLESLYRTEPPAATDIAALQNYAVEWVRAHQKEPAAAPQQKLQEANGV